jgi:hypothetical protein
LTGFSPFLTIGAPGLVIAPSFQPAAVIDPGRFGSLALDPSCLAATSKVRTTGIFYFGQSTQEAADRDFSIRGTLTVGEILTASLDQLPAPAFKGRLLALSGGNDQIFCVRNSSDLLTGYKGDCGNGNSSYTAQTRSLFPGITTFEYSITPDTGHDQNLHYNAQETFSRAHVFLGRQGY